MLAPLTGTTVSHYRLLGKIGAGGMGEVYLAEDVRLQRQVALKVLSEELTVDVERRRRAAAIEHPHIAAVYGIEEVDERTEALTLLRGGADNDDADRNAGAAAHKLATLAGALAQLGRAREATAAADAALQRSRQDNVLVPVARVYLRIGREVAALRLADELATQLQPDPQA